MDVVLVVAAFSLMASSQQKNSPSNARLVQFSFLTIGQTRDDPQSRGKMGRREVRTIAILTATEVTVETVTIVMEPDDLYQVSPIGFIPHSVRRRGAAPQR